MEHNGTQWNTMDNDITQCLSKQLLTIHYSLFTIHYSLVSVLVVQRIPTGVVSNFIVG